MSTEILSISADETRALVDLTQAFGMTRNVQDLPVIPDRMIRPKTVWFKP